MLEYLKLLKEFKNAVSGYYKMPSIFKAGYVAGLAAAIIFNEHSTKDDIEIARAEFSKIKECEQNR